MDDQKLKALDEASKQESDEIRRIVSEVVPTYQYNKDAAAVR